MITAPPLLAGATNATETCAFPAVPTTLVGAPGTVFVGGGVPPPPLGFSPQAAKRREETTSTATDTNFLIPLPPDTDALPSRSVKELSS